MLIFNILHLTTSSASFGCLTDISNITYPSQELTDCCLYIIWLQTSSMGVSKLPCHLVQNLDLIHDCSFLLYYPCNSFQILLVLLTKYSFNQTTQYLHCGNPSLQHNYLSSGLFQQPLILDSSLSPPTLYSFWWIQSAPKA